MPINPDNPILAAMSRAWDVLVAGLLFVLCSLPVITFGAALTALYATLMGIATDSCGSVVKKYFSSFGSDFKLATKVWLILLGAGLFLAGDIWACWFWMEETMVALRLLRGITVVFAIVWLCAFSYAFSGIARYVVTLPQVFRNCLVLTVQHPGYTVLILLLHLGCAAAVYLAGILSFPVLILLLYWMTKIYLRVFDTTKEDVTV